MRYGCYYASARRDRSYPHGASADSIGNRVTSRIHVESANAFGGDYLLDEPR